MIAAALACGLPIGVTMGALGGGGAILTVPILVFLLGLDPRAATAGSLVIVGVGALVGGLGHARRGRVHWALALGFGASGVAAGYLGTAMNRLADPNLLLLGFAALLVGAAAGMFAKARSSARAPAGAVAVPAPARQAALVPAAAAAASPPEAAPPADAAPPDDAAPPAEASPAAERRDAGTLGRALRILAAGSAVGFLTGFFGVGGGFVIVPALTVALGLSMPEAVGTSLLVIAINSAAALAARAGSAPFDWSVLVPFTVAVVIGSLVGRRVSDRLSEGTLTRAFGALVIVVAGYTGVQSVVALVG